MEPWRRPVQLPLPTLEYESDLQVWIFKVKLVLKHISLWHYVLISGPQPDYQNPEQAAAATYCTALLASCISGPILADIFTLASDKEALEVPKILFERARRVARAVQMARMDGSISLRDFLSDAKRPGSVDVILHALTPVPGKYDGSDRWRNVILVALLLVKRYGLARLTDAAERICEKAHDENQHVVEADFDNLLYELPVHEGRK